MALSSHENRKIALAAVRDFGVSQGVWIQLVIDMVFQAANPRALALALIVLKNHASSTWGSVLRGSEEFNRIYTIMHFLLKNDEPVLLMLALVILNRTPRFNVQLSILTPHQHLRPGHVYLQAIGGIITYSVIGPLGELIMQQPTSIKSPEPFTLEQLQLYKEDILQQMSAQQHLRRHDKSWSERLFQAVLQSRHPLAFAVLVAKCQELNVWNGENAAGLLHDLTAILPQWVSIPGFIASFLDLSLGDFNALNPNGFEPQRFTAMLTEKPYSQSSTTRELCLYLGLSLCKGEYQHLDPEVKFKFFKSIELSHEQFLHTTLDDPSETAAQRGGMCCGEY
ncbi:MAG: hypothetical protein EBY16_04790 [Gammaproteobacteria bacterium]|nr:hypothetical protein [Gammaproteobacteria bacterium]